MSTTAFLPLIPVMLLTGSYFLTVSYRKVYCTLSEIKLGGISIDHRAFTVLEREGEDGRLVDQATKRKNIGRYGTVLGGTTEVDSSVTVWATVKIEADLSYAFACQHLHSRILQHAVQPSPGNLQVDDVIFTCTCHAQLLPSSLSLHPVVCKRFRFPPRVKQNLLIVNSMLPLFLVYAGEYLIKQFIAFVLIFPISSHAKLIRSHHDFYRLYNTTYQLGIFISRSSMAFVRVHNLYAPSLFQWVNVGILVLHAIYFVPPLAGGGDGRPVWARIM